MSRYDVKMRLESQFSRMRRADTHLGQERKLPERAGYIEADRFTASTRSHLQIGGGPYIFKCRLGGIVLGMMAGARR